MSEPKDLSSADLETAYRVLVAIRDDHFNWGRLGQGAALATAIADVARVAQDNTEMPEAAE